MRKSTAFILFGLLSGLVFITGCGGTARKNNAAPGEEPVVPLNIHVAFSPNNPDNVKNWKQIIQQYYDTFLSKKLNGQLLVAKNGEILFEAYSGKPWLNRRDSLQTMNEHSALHLASVSKTFTAVAVLQLQEKGKIQIDSEVRQYLPAFPYPGITVKMLLNHRSGLPNYVHQLTTWGWPESKMATNEDLLQLLSTVKPPLAFTPNSRFAYCNTNYAILALLIEKVCGKTYSDYLSRHIFKPLGMNDTYVFALKDTATAIPSYDGRGQLFPFMYLDGVYGDKNIYSTVRDLYKWDQALYTGAIVSQQTLEAAYTPYSFEKPGIKNYGLGWRMFLFPNNKKIIFHNGWWHGNNNAFQRLIQDSATIICLGNRFTHANYSVMQLSYLFGDYPFELEAEEAQDTASAARDSLLLKAIKLRSDSLRTRATTPQNKAQAPPVKDSGILRKTADSLRVKQATGKK